MIAHVGLLRDVAWLKFGGEKAMKNRVSTLKGVVLSTLIGAVMTLAPSKTLANGGETGCPPEWTEYVTAVAEIIEPLGEDFLLLFVSREGDVFDCLERIEDKTFLEQASIYERALPVDRTGILSKDPASWPENICTRGFANWRGMAPYVSVNLPREAEILETNSCRVRVIRSAERTLSENRNDR